MCKKFIFFVFFVLIAQSIYASKLDNGFFQSGVNSFREGRYEEAVPFFEKDIESHGLSGEAAFNLGNAYYMQKKYSMALLWYKRAEKYLFMDFDLESNILKTLGCLGLEKRKSFSLRRMIPESQALSLSIIFELIFFISIAAFPKGRFKKVKAFLLSMMIFFLSISLFYYSRETFLKKALILEDTKIYSAYSYDSASISNVKKGVILSVRGYENGFYKVVYDNDRLGWVAEKDTGII